LFSLVLTFLSVALDFAHMGLTSDHLEPISEFEDRRKLAKVESAYILSRRYLQRDEVLYPKPSPL